MRRLLIATITALVVSSFALAQTPAKPKPVDKERQQLGRGGVLAKGQGDVKVDGSGNLRLEGKGTATIEGVAQGTLKAKGFRFSEGSGTHWVLKGNGTIVIKKASFSVTFTGHVRKLLAHGNGTATLTGKGSYRTLSERGSWTDSGAQVSYKTVPKAPKKHHKLKLPRRIPAPRGLGLPGG